MAKKAANSGKAITEPLYYITNQYNLREILSGGFIGSRASFDDKYYKDLLEESPGRIPLFTLPIESSLFQKVNEHDPDTSFAVVLQIDPVNLELDSSIRIKEGEKEVCIISGGTVPLKSVSTIHFLSTENQSEFEVRSYSNMPNSRELYRVSPDLARTPGRMLDILQRIKQLSPLPLPNPDQFSSLDRISGAIGLCISRSEGKEQSKQLLSLLEPEKRVKKTDKIPAWFGIGLDKKPIEKIHLLTDVNELVFASTITVLYSYNLNTVGQRPKILEEIKGLINAHPAIQADQRTTLDRSFSKIQRLLRLEDDFEPFKPSPAGFDALRGLLLFLLRPKHKELFSWSPSETNATQPVMLTALSYAGIVIGRKGLEMEYRSADVEIAQMVVAALNLISKQNAKPAKTGATPPKGKAAKSQPVAIVGNSAIAVPVQPKETLHVDWSTINEDVLNEKKDDLEFLTAAVQLCRDKGWKDCVTTVVNWPLKESFSMQPGQKSGLTLKLSGFLEISYELNFEQFKFNLPSLKTPE